MQTTSRSAPCTSPLDVLPGRARSGNPRMGLRVIRIPQAGGERGARPSYATPPVVVAHPLAYPHPRPLNAGIGINREYTTANRLSPSAIASIPRDLRMATPRKLRNAPITEALIDFRVKARKDFDASEFLALREEFSQRYPFVDERRGKEMRVEFTGAAPSATQQDTGLVGVFFSTADRTEIAQFRRDGFTLNRLRPYTSFDELAPRAIELWSTYARVARPEFITRLALRYINHVPIPQAPFELNDYFLWGPTVPPALPQRVADFLTRVTINDDRSKASAHVLHALEFDPVNERQRVLFDIDAFVQSAIEPGSPVTIDTLTELRELKNRIFFGSLTDKTLEQFDQ